MSLACVTILFVVVDVGCASDRSRQGFIRNSEAYGRADEIYRIFDNKFFAREMGQVRRKDEAHGSSEALGLIRSLKSPRPTFKDIVLAVGNPDFSEAKAKGLSFYYWNSVWKRTTGAAALKPDETIYTLQCAFDEKQELNDVVVRTSSTTEQISILNPYSLTNERNF